MIAGDMGTVRYRLVLTVLVSRLAACRRTRLKMWVFVPLMPLRDRLGWPRRPIRFKLLYRGIDTDWLVGPKTDVEILQEILLSGSYANLPIVDPQVVLDIGSHAGISLLHFRATYPDARLIGVEANPATFPRLRVNAANIQAEVHELAVGTVNGPVQLFPAEQPTLSSLHGNGGQSITVEGRTFDRLLDELGLDEVDLLKIDIEGGEHDVFRSTTRLHDIKAIVGEFHGRGSIGQRDQLFGLLKGFDVEVREDFGTRGTFVAIRRV